MNFSPFDRFQGALLGAYLGESLDNQPLIPKFNFSRTPRTQLLFSSDDSLLVPEEAILFRLLPWVLLWHDHDKRWQSRLQALAETVGISPLGIADCTLWGYGLTLMLRGKIRLDNLISKLIEIAPPLETPLRSQLAQIQSSLAENRPFLTTVSTLAKIGNPHSTAIAASLYAFLQTPEDFALAMKRASYSPCQPQLTTALVGIWAGLYNGMRGIPTAWRWQRQTSPMICDLHHLACDLYATWSGIDPQNLAQISPATAIALAGTIQPRKSLKIISQADF